MQSHQYVVYPHLKTAALDRALLVFCLGSGATVALTDDLQHVFQAIAAGACDDTALLAALNNPADDTAALQTQLDHCLRLLLQQHLIVSVAS